VSDSIKFWLLIVVVSILLIIGFINLSLEPLAATLIEFPLNEVVTLF